MRHRTGGSGSLFLFGVKQPHREKSLTAGFYKINVSAMKGKISSLTLLCLVLSGVGALNVNIPLETYEHARGDNITLPCSFKPSKPLTPEKLVIISWSAEAEKANAKETLILTHYSTGTTDIKSLYEGRVSVDIDIPSGKADLKLSSITLADNKVFECRVQIPKDDEGKPADTARLVVLVAPSTPICKIQGKTEYGQNINLTCLSEEGSPPPTYKWESRDVQNAPRAAHPRTTTNGGILSLYNISKETSGFFICTSSNKIRSATCNVTLAVMPPSMNIGSTAGIIAAVVAFLIILIIVIYCCCCRKKNKEEEYAMGVREEEFHDKEPVSETGRADGQDDKPADRRDRYEERSERGYDHRKDYDDRRSDYDDRRSDYDDRRSNYDDRRSDYNDRRSDYNDRRSDYEDRRTDYDDRRSDYSDRRDRYSDRNERYDDDHHYEDERRYNDHREDRYDEPYEEREKPPVPANKPPRKDYDE
ncbi:cell surface A33 antigen-like [Seriola lalandi dorsalis]|uniref:Cell surface A33 antigen-like n=1 Tax=Seriola lalandi dorsalis TaxID=1841481 RepID=A0A3B4XDF0_SERLL|nr:cell surface A33 antigen-like [Seriola lalandi dorsalis]